jgi:L-alanine-DL-glutamate epimerase-like enolase superfamily enzyme
MRMVGLRKPEEMAKEAGDLVQQGIKALKLKIGTGWKEDVERVRAVREAVGEKVFLKVDANQFYSVEEALRVASHLEPYRVETLEQPVQADDWNGMIHLAKNSPIPIEADQTVRTPSDALRVIRTGAAHVINTSPQKAGGILQAKRIADLCEAAGMPCIISNVAGCILNDAASIQVIAASRSAHLPCEVGESHRITGDPTHGLEVRDGEIAVPTAPGLGIEVIFPDYPK